jgi:hypothetical protein
LEKHIAGTDIYRCGGGSKYSSGTNTEPVK